MDVTQIPFVEQVGVHRNAHGLLELAMVPTVENHLKTLHASAQFTLAETASGDILQTEFPELVDKVVPLLRESSLKFKKPAAQAVVAHPTIAAENARKFRQQFDKKGRATITVDVDIKTIDGVHTCCGHFNWFVQAL